jgi:hypothetical protein
MQYERTHSVTDLVTDLKKQVGELAQDPGVTLGNLRDVISTILKGYGREEKGKAPDARHPKEGPALRIDIVGVEVPVWVPIPERLLSK